MNLLHLVTRNPHRVLPKWGLGFIVVSLISGLDNATGVVGVEKSTYGMKNLYWYLGWKYSILFKLLSMLSWGPSWSLSNELRIL